MCERVSTYQATLIQGVFCASAVHPLLISLSRLCINLAFSIFYQWIIALTSDTVDALHVSTSAV